MFWPSKAHSSKKQSTKGTSTVPYTGYRYLDCVSGRGGGSAGRRSICRSVQNHPEQNQFLNNGTKYFNVLPYLLMIIWFFSRYSYHTHSLLMCAGLLIRSFQTIHMSLRLHYYSRYCTSKVLNTTVHFLLLMLYVGNVKTKYHIMLLSKALNGSKQKAIKA